MAAPARRIPAVEVDRARLEQLFNDHHAAVWRALRRRGLSPEAAEDATQETFLLDASQDVIYAGTFGPLNSSQRSDSCHANTPGQQLLGQQAIDKWGG